MQWRYKKKFTTIIKKNYLVLLSMSNTKDSILISLDQEMTERKTQDNNIHVKISNESVS